MAKIGKFSSGLKGKPPPTRHSDGAKGYEARSSLMGTPMEPRQKPKPTIAGAAPDPTARRPQSA